MISILIPTRKRIHLLEQCISSAIDTQNHDLLVEFLIYIDKDDLETQKWINTAEQKYYDISWLIGDRIPLNDTHNKLFNKFKPNDIIMYAADDLKFNDQNWNTVVEDTFKKYDDRILLAFGRDGIHDNFPSHGFVHANWVNCIDKVFPEWLWGEYADNFMDELSSFVGRRERLELYIEHIHYSSGKRPDDETDHEKFKKQAEYGCVARFHSTRHEREADALKLLKFIKEYKNDNSSQSK